MAMVINLFLSTTLASLSLVCVDPRQRPAFSALQQPVLARVKVAARLAQSRANPPEAITSPYFEHYKPPLDLYANNLTKDTEAKLYIFVYGGREGRKGEVEERVRCIRNYLMSEHRIDGRRAVVKGGGYRDGITVEIFYRTQGQPEPSPVPTVDPKDVRLAKKSREKYKCR